MRKKIKQLVTSTLIGVLALTSVPIGVFAEDAGSVTLNMNVEGNDICPLEVLVPDTIYLEYDSATNTWRDDSTVTVKGYIDFENSMKLYVNKDVTFENDLGFKAPGYVDFGSYEEDARNFEVISRESSMMCEVGDTVVGTSYPISFITKKSDLDFAGSYEATVNFVYTLQPTTGFGMYDYENNLADITYSWQYLEDNNIISDNSNGYYKSLANTKLINGQEVDSIISEDGFSIDGSVFDDEYMDLDTISISSLKKALFADSLINCINKRIYIPSSICYIEEGAFFACRGSEFFYEGTTDEWFAIEGMTGKSALGTTTYTQVFGNVEKRYEEDVIVQCSDGYVRYAVNGSVYVNR